MPQPAYNSVNCVLRGGRPERPSIKKIRQEKCVMAASCVAIAFSLVGFSGSGVIYFKGINNQPRTSMESILTSPIACVACTKFVRIPGEGTNQDPLIRRLTTLVEDGVEMCCAYNSDQMSTLLELTMRRPELPRDPMPEFNPRDFSLSSVSAHKRLYLHPLNLNASTEVPVFPENTVIKTYFKKDNDPLVEHFRGVLVKDEGLEILTSGQYMVYSSIHFRPDSARPCKDFRYQVWGHYVEKERLNDPAASGCILKTTHTCCDQCTRDDETSFASGVFYLKAGDILRVSVSAHGLIYFGKQSSFAGLMMMGSDSPRN